MCWCWAAATPLCAALAAREAGASVLVLECAPIESRGGNSRHTRNLRCMHDAPEDVLIESYREDEYWDDLSRVTSGRTDESLARLTIRESACGRGCENTACTFSPRSVARCISGTNAFFSAAARRC